LATTITPPEDKSPRIQAGTRPPFYRDTTVVKWIVQLATLAAVIFAMLFLANVAGDNLALRNISTSFDFLSIDPGISLSEGIDTEPVTGGRALWVGMVNTLRLSIAGIFFATILGTLVGLARLSNNWLVNKMSSVFVETLRNIPLLVQIIIIAAILTGLGRVTLDSGPYPGWLHITNKGIGVPRLHVGDVFYQWAVVMLFGCVAAWFIHRNRSAVRDATGRDTRPVLTALATLLVFGIIGYFIHPIFSFLDGPLRAISDAIGSIPQIAVQLALSVLVVVLAANWIRRFLNSRRTPAGLAKLTDDDYFRMIFAALGALVACLVFLRLWPGLSDWLINSTSDLFTVLADKFGDSREAITEQRRAAAIAADPEAVLGSGSPGPFGFEQPNIVKRGNFANYGTLGINMSVGFAAIFLGVWLYTSAFIGEIVRGGVLAVAKGQTEAAMAVGLKRSQALRQVILPQAFRIILPPMGNQYLNLTKNTSLAIAVGFSDMVQVGQTVSNQTGRVLPVLLITMLFYLACSLTISVIVNWFNVRLKIVER